MQCPNCGQDSLDSAHSQHCDWKAGASAHPANTFEGNATQEPVVNSNAPLTQEPPILQAVDSTLPTDKTEPEPKEQPAEPSASSGAIDVTGRVSAQGDLSLIGQLNAFFGKTEPEAKVEERALYDLTKKLPPRPARRYRSTREELDAVVDKLKENRLILIGCAYAEYALDAAYEVIEGLAVAGPEQTRILSYEETDGQNLDFRVQKLLEQRPDAEGDSIILVDALNTLAQAFPGSILGHSVHAGTIKEDLRANKHFLVVLVSLDYARQTNLVHQNFPYWEISFLQPFLREHFPDEHAQLEARITSQREEGVWEKDEPNFCQQIIDYYDSRQLREIVERGGPDDPETSATSLLKGSGPVVKTVLYTAAFFQEITPPEFCRVVEALLAERTICVASPVSGGKGGDALAQTQTETPLARIWEEEKDNIFSEWLRESYVAKDSVRVVSLSNSALREPLRKLFEKRYRFYVIDQFKTLQERGIFFYPSVRVAESVIQIAIGMSGVYPDEFSEGWIVEIVSRLRQHFDLAAPSTVNGEDAMFRFLRSSQPGALNLALARVSDIFRRMLELPQLRGMVKSSLEQLINGGHHEVTLLLIKQLQFTAEFDTLYWFKQLLHRADPVTRGFTSYYLYSYLKGRGSGIYEGLKKVEEWLPHADRDPRTYSPVDYLLLQLLIQYCVETVARFNEKHYGDWPSRYPLFAIKDSETAAGHVSLLSTWLLHPGIGATLARLRMGGTQMTLIGALLAEWAFILIGPGGTSHAGEPGTSAGSGAGSDGGSAQTPDTELSAPMLLDLLIGQFASKINFSQRLELLKYWNELNHDLLKCLGMLPRMSELRSQLGWKRELVRRLITQLKNAALPSTALSTR